MQGRLRGRLHARPPRSRDDPLGTVGTDGRTTCPRESAESLAATPKGHHHGMRCLRAKRFGFSQTMISQARIDARRQELPYSLASRQIKSEGYDVASRRRWIVHFALSLT